MSKEPIPSWFIVVVAVEHQGRFLLIQERKHGQTWYFPAGRVEPGEDFVAAAERETLEEAGLAVRITGIVRIEHSQKHGHHRVRFLFKAEPAGDSAPKSRPDKESLAAAWFTLDEIRTLPLRAYEVVEVFEYLQQRGAIVPLAFLAPEGSSIGRIE